MDQYVKVEDWRVKENSTVTYSVSEPDPRTRDHHGELLA